MKTTVYVGTSLDGFIAREDGDIDWLVKYQNKEVHDSYHEFISRIDAMVIGRGTFEKVITFPEWPYEKKVFVLSISLKQIPETLNEKAILVAMEPAALLSYLSDKGFSNIYVDGGKVIQSFLKEDLIDELIITKVPELIGSGIPLFGYLNNDLRFEHIRTNIYSDGLVKSQYERKH
jgi:dihydrofolate reductase